MYRVCHRVGGSRRHQPQGDSRERFLLDQDVYASTARFLRDLGHDAMPVVRLGLSQAENEELLRVAQRQGRTLVTRDRHFGNLAFVQGVGTSASLTAPRLQPPLLQQALWRGDVQLLKQLYSPPYAASAANRQGRCTSYPASGSKRNWPSCSVR
ncbi:MAG: DUF5615 family PIN-like protein [Anaerolineae bacterium]